MFSFFKISGTIVSVLSTGNNKKDYSSALLQYRDLIS